MSTSSSGTPRPTARIPSTDDVADEYLFLAPSLLRHRDGLITLARAWRGEEPWDFFTTVASLIRDLDWLRPRLERWVEPALIELMLCRPSIDATLLDQWREERGLSFDHESSCRQILTRGFIQFEGLLLLSMLEFGTENESAHQLLRRTLAQIDDGIRTGTPKRLRRHPLKDLIQELDRPHSIEALVDWLSLLLPKVSAQYPRFGRFLREAYVPIARGLPTVWRPPLDVQESDFLDVDKSPEHALPENTPPWTSSEDSGGGDFSVVGYKEKRPFSATDLPDEMFLAAKELESDRAGLMALARAWRGGETWQFYESIGRLAYLLSWLPPLLEKWCVPSTLESLRKATHSTRRKISWYKSVNRWRETNRIEPRCHVADDSLHTEKDPDCRWGIDSLKGLLLLGRLEWGPWENADEQESLAALINDLQARFRSKDVPKELEGRYKPQHPLEPVLAPLHGSQTAASFAAKLVELLPEIAGLDPAASKLLKEAYLPLVAGGSRGALPIGPPLPSDPSFDLGNGRVSNSERHRPPRRRTGRGNRLRTTIRRARVGFPGNELPLPGESTEETESIKSTLRRSEARTDVVPLRQEVLWARQRVWGTNPLLVRDHIESLSDPEAHALATALLARVAADIDLRSFDDAWLGMLVALILITGRGATQWGQTKFHSVLSSSITFADRPQLFVNEGVLRIPVLRPEAAFEPTESMRSMLEPTVPFLDLSLPPTLSVQMRALVVRAGQAGISLGGDELKKALQRYLSEIEPAVGTGMSLARVRRVARARIREISDDLVQTMLLCGDDFGISTAPLYYSSLTTRKLQESFSRAAWPLFGDHPVPAGHAEEIRVGSQLLVTENAARMLARSPAAAMRAPGRSNGNRQQLVSDHNCLVNHTVCMLVSVAGHRPTNALFALTRFDFDTVIHGAAFQDKQCDPAHLCRYAPVGDIVSAQIERLLEHLRALRSGHELPARALSHVEKALIGEGPLFFHLATDATPMLLTVETWTPTLPTNWKVLPLNWGRTWLASRGRDAGCLPDHLAITLGHLEASGFPFSRESPMEPAGLSREVSGALGKLARNAGWVLCGGLRSSCAEANRLEELGPLRGWNNERDSWVEQVKAYELEQRRVSRAALRNKQDEGETIALISLFSVVQTSLPTFEDLKALRRRRRKDQPASPSFPEPALDVEGLERIQDAIDKTAGASTVLRIAAHNALHRYMKSAHIHIGWTWPIPAPWLAPSTLEPAPFFPGLFRATAQVHALRNAFSAIPPKPPAETEFSPFEWACGIAMIALCIFGFAESLTQVRAILDGRNSNVRSRTIKDLLLVEVGERKSVAGVRGLAAVALARLATGYPNDELPGDARMDAVLAAQIPSALVGDQHGIASRLCATVGVSNIVEISGLARLAMDPDSGSVSMSVARQRQLLEEGYGTEEVSGVGAVSQEDIRIASRKRGLTVARKQFIKLRETLHIGAGPKTFPLTGGSLSQANITSFRNPLARELSAFLAQEDLCQIVACLGAFALHLTTEGTREKAAPAWSTVHKYLTSFGAGLVDLAAGFDFLHLDAEEYIELYQNIIDTKSGAGQRAVAARELFDFHAYLQAYHGVEVVDFSDLEGADARPAGQVDAEVVQPQEYLRGLRIIESKASLTSVDQAIDSERRRLFRQAHIFTVLLRSSGARINEVAALLFKDVLATENSTVLLLRPSRYRHLKTRAARRVFDITSRLSRVQRKLITDWIVSERARLRAAWKPTLPLFGKLDAPKERIQTTELREIALGALEEAAGSRTKIHRFRHLVASEDMLSSWLARDDWNAMRCARLRSRRRAARYASQRVVMPRDMRKISFRLGHRRSSTTIINYFHMAWATVSRPHHALQEFVDRHSGAVVLGVSAAGADKIVQRGENSPGSGQRRRRWGAIWLTHLVGEPSATPGRSAFDVARGSVGVASRTQARRIGQLLRDIQLGVPPRDALVSHGLTEALLASIKSAAGEVERRTGFRIWPRNSNAKRTPRSARLFRAASSIEAMLGMLDRDHVDADRQLVLKVAQAHLMWANKGKRDLLQWPQRDAEHLTKLLTKLGVGAEQIKSVPLPEQEGFVEIRVLREAKSTKFMNNEIAWLLAVVHIADCCPATGDGSSEPSA